MRHPHESTYLKAFGKRLAQVRRSKGFTQEQLAEKADLTVLSVTYFETGRRWPRLSTLKRLATSLNVGIGELFEGV